MVHGRSLCSLCLKGLWGVGDGGGGEDVIRPRMLEAMKSSDLTFTAGCCTSHIREHIVLDPKLQAFNL